MIFTSPTRFTLLAITILIGLSSCEHKKDTSSSNNEAITKEVDRICDSMFAAIKVPGMTVGIWDATKNFTYVKTRGYANTTTKEAMNTSGAFRIGSNTKTFTVTVILQLVDEHKLSLDDTIGKFFPGFKNGSLITVRMLCNMRSGIPNYTNTQAFSDSLAVDPHKQWEPMELVNLVTAMPFTTPNTITDYSNTNTVMLGIIIQQLTSKSLTDNIKDRICNKLSLPNTYMPADYHMPANAIHGYMNFTDSTTFSDDATELLDASGTWAAGGMVSNLYEVKTAVEAFVSGDLVSPGLLQERFTGGILSNTVTYGLGMFSFGKDMWGHNGGIPGYLSIMMHHRTKNITYVIFYNWQNQKAIPDALYNRLVPVVNPEL